MRSVPRNRQEEPTEIRGLNTDMRAGIGYRRESKERKTRHPFWQQKAGTKKKKRNESKITKQINEICSEGTEGCMPIISKYSGGSSALAGTVTVYHVSF